MPTVRKMKKIFVKYALYWWKLDDLHNFFLFFRMFLCEYMDNIHFLQNIVDIAFYL